MLWLNDYERRARLLPGLVAIFPIVIVLVTLGLRQLAVVSSFVSGLTVIGGPALLAGAVRHWGQKAEHRLWEKWGGPPTTRWLRLRGESDSEFERDLWRNAVSAISGMPLPSLRAERSNAEKADKVIVAAVKRIRDRTRDKERFDILFSENRTYGQERNMYGIRWAGRLIALSAMGFLVTYGFWLSKIINRPVHSLEMGIGSTICFLVFLWWCLWPSENRVRGAADKYANELLHSAVTLHEDAMQAQRNEDASP
jgi:hypothetical protein